MHQEKEKKLLSSNWVEHWSSRKIDYDIMKVSAKYFVDCYKKYFGFSQADIVLDFGAGLGDVSFLIKDKVRRIYLYDKSLYLMSTMKRRFDKFQNVYIVNHYQEINETVSVIIINSVIQYMSHDEIKDLFSQLQDICNIKTRIIISDIVPSNYSKILDGLSQLKASIKYMFFKKYISSIITNIISNPNLSLKTSVFYMYDEDEIKQILFDHGYTSTKMDGNFSYSLHRYTLECKLIDIKKYEF